jgi:uncharacterized membrane protein YoaK (UPF0700 family)
MSDFPERKSAIDTFFETDLSRALKEHGRKHPKSTKVYVVIYLVMCVSVIIAWIAGKGAEKWTFLVPYFVWLFAKIILYKKVLKNKISYDNPALWFFCP